MRGLKINLFFILLALACNRETPVAKIDDPEILHRNEKNLTELTIHDIFSPPVASRIYAYTSLAAHEALRHMQQSEQSIVAKLKGFPEMPVPDKKKKYDFMLAASKAFYTVMFNITFSKDTIKKFEEKTYKAFEYNRKSTRLNSSHSQISYAVFCLKK